MRDAIVRAVAGEHASEDEMCALVERLVNGEGTPAQIASLLTALRIKGETVDELVGAARAMRAHMLRVETERTVVDTCGTGGGDLATFNVSTAAALVVAGAGAAVVKHGNRAVSGRVGSADVLEALGVRIDLPPEGVAHCLAHAGVGFCFAPRFHPAMRFAVAPRREIGIRTMFNLLGPLANPAGAAHQLIGVFAPEWTEPMAAALGRLGTRRAFVVHGSDGIDEISAAAPTRVSEMVGGVVRTYSLRPEDFGLTAVSEPVPRVDDADTSATIIREVLAGRAGPARAIVLINAAAVLVAAGIVTDWRTGVSVATASIDGGGAARALARLVEASTAETTGSTPG